MDETPVNVAAVPRLELNGTAGVANAPVRRRDRRRPGSDMMSGRRELKRMAASSASLDRVRRPFKQVQVICHVFVFLSWSGVAGKERREKVDAWI